MNAEKVITWLRKSNDTSRWFCLQLLTDQLLEK